MKNTHNVLIFGMGLMGGSLSLAIKRKYPRIKITGVVRSEKSKATILEHRLADEIFTETVFLANSNWNTFDLVVFATPVQSVIDYIMRLPLNGKTIFTDLGSTKETIITAVDSHFTSIHNYVSSHPMCGSEFSGPESAKVDLYDDKLCILTRAENSSEDAFEFVRNFWADLGAWTFEIEAREHDITLAYLSHLPHIISSLLVQTSIQSETVNKVIMGADRAITGAGFRDMSRIAGSNFDMWISIFSENRKFIFKSLKDFQIQLNDLLEAFDPVKDLDSELIRKFWISALAGKEKIQKLK